MDRDGNAIVVWVKLGGIWANRYDATNRSWGDAVVVDTKDSPAHHHDVAMHANGSTIVVWRQRRGSLGDIWANRYDAVSGDWGKAQLVETDHVLDDLPQVAMDARGNATVLWTRWGGAPADDLVRCTIWANRYDAADKSWGKAVLIKGSEGAMPSPPLDMDPQGNAITVWTARDDDMHWHVCASRYDAATGVWGTPLHIESSKGRPDDPQVAVDSWGNAAAVWDQVEGALLNVWACRYDAARERWGKAELIETTEYEARRPRVAMDAKGNATVLWEVFNGVVQNIRAMGGGWSTSETFEGAVCSIWARRYDVGRRGWSNPENIQTEPGIACGARVAVSSNGDAVAVWEQPDEGWHVCVNNFDGTLKRWGQATRIGTNISGGCNPDVAMDSRGNAITVWEQHDGLWYSIWAEPTE